MKFLIPFAVLFAIYYFRRYWLTPWARFVSMTTLKRGDVFLTVKHVRWYPPFLDYEHTYHKLGKGLWSEEKTGHVPSHNNQTKLVDIMYAAEARNAETEELSS